MYQLQMLSKFEVLPTQFLQNFPTPVYYLGQCTANIYNGIIVVIPFSWLWLLQKIFVVYCRTMTIFYDNYTQNNIIKALTIYSVVTTKAHRCGWCICRVVNSQLHFPNFCDLREGYVFIKTMYVFKNSGVVLKTF